jgi:tetratricopeptide (TPR) repeat protein
MLYMDIKPHHLDAWHNKCLSLYNLRKYKEVIDASDVTIRLHAQYALSWFDEYNKLSKLGKYDEAIEAYDWGLELYTKNTLFFVIRGDAILNLALWNPNGFKYALDAYNRAIRLDPLNMIAWCGRCFALNALGYTDAAREAYEHADRLTLLKEQPYQYIVDSEKPFYWM